MGDVTADDISAGASVDSLPDTPDIVPGSIDPVDSVDTTKTSLDFNDVPTDTAGIFNSQTLDATSMVSDAAHQYMATSIKYPDGSAVFNPLDGSNPFHILPDGQILNGLNIPDGSISWNGGHGTIFDAVGQVAYTIDGNQVFDSMHQVAYTVRGNQIVDSLGQVVMTINKA